MTADAKPLTPAQRQSAVLTAQGRLQSEISEIVGVVERTLTRWSHREDWRSIVKEHREELVPGSLTAQAVLEAALDATKKDGSEDWDIRLRAATALLKSPVADDQAQERLALASSASTSPRRRHDPDPRRIVKILDSIPADEGVLVVELRDRDLRELAYRPNLPGKASQMSSRIADAR